MKYGIAWLMLVLIAACQPAEKVDLLLHNAKIYTVDSNFSQATAMAVKNGRIQAIGQNGEIAGQFKADTALDMNGKYVYPGFHDPHCHFYGYAQNLRQADLRGTQSFHDILEKLKTHSRKYNSPWILGRGWDQNDWPEKAYPNRKQLDSIFPDKPVYLTRIDGHAAIVNGKALEMAGITPNANTEGGEFLKQDGKLTGVLIDNAMRPVKKLIPSPDKKVMKKLLQRAEHNVHQVGLTALSDAGLTRSQIALLDTMQRHNALKLKVDAWLAHDSATIAYFTSRGIYSTPWLKVGAIKMYADGALGSRGARLLKPYADAPGAKGLWVTSRKTLDNLCRLAYEKGFQVAVHAIGDAANRRALDVYSNYLKPGNDRRWRIEHAQVVHAADLKRFGKLNVVPSVQTTHATSDMYWAGDRLGADRLSDAYAYQDLLQQNGWLPNGSDFPVEEINPLYGFYAAVARKDQKGYPGGGFQKGNALSRKQALRAMTIWAAKASFSGHKRGSLEQGKVADFVVLEKDLMKAPEKELYSLEVLQTWINGARVY